MGANRIRRRGVVAGLLGLWTLGARAWGRALSQTSQGAPAADAGAGSPPAKDPSVPGAPVVQPPPAATPDGPRVRVKTPRGDIVLELAAAKAPITCANFLRYVRTRRFDGSSFYRVVRTPGAPTTGLVQGGLQNDPTRLLAPIRHESTAITGLKHLDGVISMARNAPGTATADFFICVGDTPSLDADPAAPGDNQGFAAFGRVIEGMEVVRTILALPSNGKARNPVMQGQILDPPVPILSMRLAG